MLTSSYLLFMILDVRIKVTTDTHLTVSEDEDTDSCRSHALFIPAAEHCPQQITTQEEKLQRQLLHFPSAANLTT